ncbi:rhamnulokinase family protein [Herbiconiux sp. A18JL235]|uniref:Rhamnulokinase family protein n=1 Tax=Herbiconiux sp. A18JL235 TaxID=3152363 RepID=A0AB39BDE2_9MICO
MPAPHAAYAAVDLGASSGRVMLGFVERGSGAADAGDGSSTSRRAGAASGAHGTSAGVTHRAATNPEPGRVRMLEVHRFPNGPLPSSLASGETLRWDAERLFEATLDGLAIAASVAREHGRELAGIGIDSWGVDYGLLDAAGRFDGTVEHYRGAPAGAPADADAVVAPRRSYAVSGVPPQTINTSYRLRAAALSRDETRASGTVVLVPDLWVWLLSGALGAERTIASTTQLLEARSGEWSRELIEAWGLGSFTFPEPADAGSLAGYTLPHISRRLGVEHPVAVYRVAGHDTASALAFATPGDGQLLVSSGSWSVAGVSLAAPQLDESALAADLTNERSVGEQTLLLRNLSGMWLLVECVREWSEEDGRMLDPVALVREAAARDDLGAPVFDVGDPRLVAPGAMPQRIAQLCAEAGGVAPEGRIGTVRSIIESLAVAYAETARSFGTVLGEPLVSVRIVGGGSQNELLCRRTAELAGLPVVAGPAEASAFGNLAVQLVAAGEFADLEAVYAAGGDAGGVTARYEPDRPFVVDRSERTTVS